MIKQVLLIGFGGFAGGVSRYYVSKLNLSYDLLAVLIGTLTVNIPGSFLIGFLTGIAEKSPIMTANFRLLLMV